MVHFSKSESVKVKYLLLWSGEEGIDVSSTWDLSDNESNTYLCIGTVSENMWPQKTTL